MRKITSAGSPRAIAVAENGEVYVADASNHIVKKIVLADPSGADLGSFTSTTLCGSGKGNAPGSGAAAKFATPSTLTWTPEGLLMSDEDNRQLWVLR